MVDQQEQNQSEGFVKRNLAKGKDMAKDKVKQAGKKKAKQILLKILANPITWKILIILTIVIVSIVFISTFVEKIEDAIQELTNDAKQQAVSITITPASSGSSSSGETGSSGSSSGATDTDDSSSGETDSSSSSSGDSSSDDSEEEDPTILIRPTEDNDSYEIVSAYEEDIETIRTELDAQYMNDLSDFSDFDITVLAGLADKGLDLDRYREDQLKCLSQFLKAEYCTQLLDLRPNSEKFDSDGKYQPRLMSDLEENEVPGIILIQRTNTKEETPKPLEYMMLEEFDELVENKDKKVLDYFTISEEEKLRIAKWNHEVVTVEDEEDYPEELSDDQKVQDKDELNIWTEDIDYLRYISKYTMPFDFLTQLLVISEDTEFCLDVADIVLGSKIVINIQEEETITTTVDKRTFDVHNKVEKKIDYSIGNESANEYLLGGATDENGEECTTYENKVSTVKVTTVYTSHTYVLEIVEADIWYARYEKIYKDPTEKNESLPEQIIEEHPEDYTLVEANKKEITNTDDILADEHASAFKEAREKHYKDQIENPTVSLTSNKKEIYDPTQQKFVEIPGTYKVSIWHKYGIKDPTWSSKEFSTYADLPSPLNITTNKTNDFPFEIKFSFPLGINSYGSPSRDTSAIVCNITRLLILPYNKINIDGTINTSIKKYESDSEPTTKSRIYERRNDGHFEKFLKAYDDNEKAVGLISDVDSWLYEMMEENENTIHLVDIIKYLLYLYDGVDRGVTELDIDALMKPLNMSLVTGVSIPLTTPILSREDFIKALEEYDGGGNYVEDFRNNAGQIYDWGIKYGVNPELIVTFALKEQSFRRPSSGNYNYWGLDTPNGAGVTPYPTMESGIKRFAELVNWYVPGGKRESWVTKIAEERQAAECNTNGYGPAGTLKGYLSVYSDLCGSDTKHRPGSGGDGGNYYLKIIYGDEFNAKCGNVHKIGVDDYTIQEKADYTAWLYEKQIEYWTDIFGKYGSLGTGTVIIEFAMQYLGYSESQMYSILGISYPWCAYFATWCYRECGYVPSAIDQIYGVCSDIMNNGKRKNAWYPKNTGYIPMPGDFIIYGYRSENNLAHVGLVVECDGSRVHTIEGNWGDAVKTRDLPMTGSLPDSGQDIIGYVSLAGLLGN